jgi:hypothetical protein
MRLRELTLKGSLASTTSITWQCTSYKGELGSLKKDITEIERMLKALIKSLENKPWNPGTLFSN